MDAELQVGDPVLVHLLPTCDNKRIAGRVLGFTEQCVLVQFRGLFGLYSRWHDRIRVERILSPNANSIVEATR